MRKIFDRVLSWAGSYFVRSLKDYKKMDEEKMVENK
jgi:hypothetical protein